MSPLLKAWFRCCTVILVIAGVLGVIPSLGTHHNFNNRKYEYVGVINVRRLVCAPPSEAISRATLEINHAPSQKHLPLLVLSDLLLRSIPSTSRPARVQRPVAYHRRFSAPAPSSPDPLI